MRTNRGAQARRRGVGVLLAITLLAAAAACGDSHRVSGAYRSDGAVVFDDVPGLEQGVWVELVLGQYGPDVAGIIRFYAENGIPVPPEGVCGCRFLIDGRFEDDELVFAFPNPSPCAAVATTLLAARLTASKDGDTLTGPMGRTLAGGRDWTFNRYMEAVDLGDQDRQCEPLETGDVPVGGAE